MDAHRKIIYQLTLLRNFYWNNKGEMNAYWRRVLPRYLITWEASEYPCYVFQSDLSKAFNAINFITVNVNLSEYKEDILWGLEDTGKMVNPNEKFSITIQESLLTNS